MFIYITSVIHVWHLHVGPCTYFDVPPVARYKLNIRRPKQKNILDTSIVDAPVVDGPSTTPLLFMPTPRFTRRKDVDKDPV